MGQKVNPLRSGVTRQTLEREAQQIILKNIEKPIQQMVSYFQKRAVWKS